jgi:ABC-type cobalamin/Fe3+-siderophores transport system ATPase subunit
VTLTAPGSPPTSIVDEDVSFPLAERSLLAVFGPSGAGKSTLLGALSGLAPATQGGVRYDSRDLYANLGELCRRIGLVPQEDILHTQLPVRRALRYAAELRFAGDTDREERNRRVEEVLGELGLQDQAEQRIDSVSGGQRKRVNIALELLTTASLLLLDEPTSGLGPGLDESVMQTLRGLADEGRSVIVATPQRPLPRPLRSGTGPGHRRSPRVLRATRRGAALPAPAPMVDGPPRPGKQRPARLGAEVPRLLRVPPVRRDPTGGPDGRAGRRRHPGRAVAGRARLVRPALDLHPAVPGRHIRGPVLPDLPGRTADRPRAADPVRPGAGRVGAGLAIASMVAGLVVSASVKTAETTMPLLGVATMLQVFLSGALMPLSDRAALNWLSWLSPSRWAMAAIASTINLSELLPALPPHPTDELSRHEAHTWLVNMGMVLVLTVALCLAVLWPPAARRPRRRPLMTRAGS